MRLDAYISTNSDLSRSLAQIAIKNQRVSVNGVTARVPSLKINGSESIQLDGMPLKALGQRYLMLHKPAGYVCANTDAEHPIVLDLLELPNKQRLQIAGRLDLDTTGLVLLTDDGQWNHRITAPKRNCTKVYLVTTADPISPDAQARFNEGLLLQGETKPTLPAQLEQLDSHSARLRIQEGKYHQVKRMFAALGNRVVALHREQIGTIHLDPTLKPGQYRALTSSEVNGVSS